MDKKNPATQVVHLIFRAKRRLAHPSYFEGLDLGNPIPIFSTEVNSTIIHLTKVRGLRILLLIEAKCYFGLDIAVDREACNCFLKSRLMLANNFLVGTHFKLPRFSFASKGELL